MQGEEHIRVHWSCCCNCAGVEEGVDDDCCGKYDDEADDDDAASLDRHPNTCLGPRVARNDRMAFFRSFGCLPGFDELHVTCYASDVRDV